jgi:hypothetical protein
MATVAVVAVVIGVVMAIRRPAVPVVGGRYLPSGPLVVNGSTGFESSNGKVLLTLNGGLEVVTASDPILRIAHILIIPDSTVKAEYVGYTGGNTPDQFVWNGDWDYKLNGQSGTFSLLLDGRTHTFHAAGESFDLAKGNFFRVKVMPGWRLVVEQIPVIDVIEDVPTKIEARFAAFERGQGESK